MMKMLPKMIKKILIIIGCIVLFGVVFGVSAILTLKCVVEKPLTLIKVDWKDQSGTIYKDLPYDNEYHNCYDLYIPANLDPNENHALVLYIHGGGFTGGSKSSGENWGKFFAYHGYIAASMDYTVSNKEHTSDLHRMNQEIDDCVTAIYQKCEELGYHVTMMATTGESAGGCLAMLYAYSQGENAAIPVKFVFQQTGPADFDPVGWGSQEGDWAAAASFVSMMSGREITAEMAESGEIQRFINEISPAALVNENTVPTLCAYGPKDKVVPVGLKFKLFEAFEKYGVTYDYIEFPNSNHGMYSDMDKQQLFIEKVLEYCKTYFGY